MGGECLILRRLPRWSTTDGGSASEDYYKENRNGRSKWPYASVLIDHDGFSALNVSPYGCNEEIGINSGSQHLTLCRTRRVMAL